MKGKTLRSGAVGGINVLINDTQMCDATSVTLPAIAIPSTELKGAGIMGTRKIPQTGQLEAMTMTISLRRLRNKGAVLTGREVRVEVRLATDIRASDGTLYLEGTKFYSTGTVSKVDGGKGEGGSPRDESIELDLSRHREVVDGQETLLVDVDNIILKVDGVDLMTDYRRILL